MTHCRWLICYCLQFRKHKDDAPANDDEENDAERKKNQEVPKWDAEFLKVDQGTLFGKTPFKHALLRDWELLTGQATLVTI